MRKLFLFLVPFAMCFVIGTAHAVDAPQNTINTGKTTNIDTTKNFETCAQSVFANALRDNQKLVRETDADYVVQGWVYNVFQQKDTINKVMQCPGAAAMDGAMTLQIPPIVFQFPLGRQIVVNYSTQLQILRARQLIAGKKTAPTAASARVDPAGGDTWVNTDPEWYGALVVRAGALDKYVGADGNDTISPKYMVEHPDEFLPRNNPLIGAGCTSYDALANDNDIINISAHKTVGEKSGAFSGNDYYVSGAKNLQWITWTEVALDVAATVATFGGGAVISAGAKTLRINRTAGELFKSIRALEATEDVIKYKNAVVAAREAGEALKVAQESAKALESGMRIANMPWADAKRLADVAEKMKNLGGGAGDAAKIAGKIGAKTEDVEKVMRMSRQESDGIIEMVKHGNEKIAAATADAAKDAEEMNKLLDEASAGKGVDQYIRETGNIKTLAEMRANLKPLLALRRGNVVARSVDATKGGLAAVRDLPKIMDYQKALRNLERAKKLENAEDIAKFTKEVGELEKLDDVIKYKNAMAEARAVKSAVKTVLSANKQIDKIAASAGKASTRAGRIRDFLFKPTAALKNAAIHGAAKSADAAGKIIAGAAIVHGVINFAENMYDWSVTETDKYTSGIMFNAFGLLSADDLDNQSNELSHGMFLMWAGDSMSPADDDAAFLMAMDFASKFHTDITNTQDELGSKGRAAANMCDVDIYVVRPIIKNPGTDDELFYLIMNDTPWRVRATVLPGGFGGGSTGGGGAGGQF